MNPFFLTLKHDSGFPIGRGCAQILGHEPFFIALPLTAIEPVHIRLNVDGRIDTTDKPKQEENRTTNVRKARILRVIGEKYVRKVCND